MMRLRVSIGFLATAAVLVAAPAIADTFSFGGPNGFKFQFGRDDNRRDVEGKRASCELYARIAVIQADSAQRYRCGLRGPAWTTDPAPHFRWCRFVPRQRIAEETRARSTELQRCFDGLGDFDDNRWR